MEFKQTILPKSIKYRIGKKEFEFVEFTCLKRDTLLNIIGSFTLADIMSSVFPILDELNIKLEGEEDAQIGKLIQLALQNKSLWGALILGLVNVLRVGADIICLSLSEKDSLEENELYIKNNLTISQEPMLLSVIIALNELPETLKNYKALIADIKDLIKMKNS